MIIISWLRQSVPLPFFALLRRRMLHCGVGSLANNRHSVYRSCVFIFGFNNAENVRLEQRRNHESDSVVDILRRSSSPNIRYSKSMFERTLRDKNESHILFYPPASYTSHLNYLFGDKFEEIRWMVIERLVWLRFSLKCRYHQLFRIGRGFIWRHSDCRQLRFFFTPTTFSLRLFLFRSTNLFATKQCNEKCNDNYKPITSRSFSPLNCKRLLIGRQKFAPL